jgi:AcrR family transcriptional regulator
MVALQESTMIDGEAQVRRPRERILAAARELFRRHGIHGVGVEAIADAAKTNKMALYRHFGSKDELVVAYLQSVVGEVDDIWTALERDHPGDGRKQLKAWLSLAEVCIASDERGCELATSAIELTAKDHPGRKIIEDLKVDHRKRLVTLCRRAGVSQPSVLADTLTLLLEGARVSRQSAGAKGPSAKFMKTAKAVITNFLPH